MVRRIATLPVPVGKAKAAVARKSVNEEAGNGKVSVESAKRAVVAGYGALRRSRAGIQENKVSFNSSEAHR